MQSREVLTEVWEGWGLVSLALCSAVCSILLGREEKRGADGRVEGGYPFILLVEM